MVQSANNLVAVNDHHDSVRFQVINKVLDLDLLLDMILDYVIHDKGKVKTCNVQSCRQVNKAWLQSINRVLRKCGEPLFTFDLCKENISARGTDQPGQGNILDQFMRSATGNLGLELDKRLPPYAITTTLDKTIEQSAIPIFFDCLVNCWNGLTLLNLGICPPSPVPLNKTILLPNLSSLTISEYTKRNVMFDGQRDDTVDFIQSVLDATRKLKSFTLISPSSDCFETLLLPSSITYLELCSVLNDCKLQALANSFLSRLKTLKLVVDDQQMSTALITNVLKKFGKTLQTLDVKHKDNSIPTWTKPCTVFQIPLMEKLTRLSINTPCFEVQGEHYLSCLQQFVPMLTQLTLRSQTRSMFRKWTDNSCFPSVIYLNVSMICDDDERRVLGLPEEDHSINIDLLTMQSLHLAFPNVRELVITEVELFRAAIVFVMRKMTNLHCLRIRGLQRSRTRVWESWDAVLIGIPAGLVDAVRESPDLWESLQVGNCVSIRNLTELQTLELEGAYQSDVSDISDVAFQCGFLKMPKLVNLILKKGFWATRKMTRVWEREGRSIETDRIHQCEDHKNEPDAAD